jgi:hypothetical protein
MRRCTQPKLQGEIAWPHSDHGQGLGGHLKTGHIMASRAERVIYVVPSPGIPYSRFVTTLSSLKKTVPDLHIGLLSGEVENCVMHIYAARLPRLYLPFGIVWPAGEF